MSPLFVNLMWLRRFGGTQRFHTEPFLGPPQTVFHHSASTALILLQILKEKVTQPLLIAALLHDLEEGVTGDIPAPVKWNIGGIAIERLEEKIRNHFGIENLRLSSEERHLLICADVLDGMLTCLDQKLIGNYFISYVFDNYEGFVKRAHLLDERTPQEFKDVFYADMGSFGSTDAWSIMRLMNNSGFWKNWNEPHNV